MNVLTAVTLDIIEHIKERTKNLEIKPLVVWNDPTLPQFNSYKYGTPRIISYYRKYKGIFTKPIPNNYSPTKFYVEHEQIGTTSFILIKKKKSPLRVISLSIDQAQIQLISVGYWRAYGFIQHEESCYRSRIYGRHGLAQNDDPDIPPEGFENHFNLQQINRVRKQRIKKRDKLITITDTYCYQDHEPDFALIDIMIKTIEQSYNWNNLGCKESIACESILSVDIVAQKNHLKIMY